MGLKETDGLLVSPGKATDRPSDYWLTAQVRACPEVVQVEPFIHISLNGLGGWLYLKHFLDVMISLLGKWRQRPDITIAIDWNV